jgi:hypothetical protein
MRQSSKMTWMLAAAVALVYGSWNSTAEAKLFGRRADAQPAGEKVVSPSDQVLATEGAVISSGSPSCCPERCIKYRHHCTLRKTCCSCDPPVQTILAVQDPCCCKCMIEIPICLPGCCEGSPKVCDRQGLLGRGIVTYEWCCGYKVKIVFDRCGDIVVHSYGR